MRIKFSLTAPVLCMLVYPCGRACAQWAQIASPTPGSQLPGIAVTFTWNAISGADSYWLDVGTALALGNVCGGQIAGTSSTCSGIPTQPGVTTIYVQLWTHSNGAWQTPNQYTYAAPGDFTVSMSPVSASAAPGKTAQYTVTVNPIGGFSQPVFLTALAPYAPLDSLLWHGTLPGTLISPNWSATLSANVSQSASIGGPWNVVINATSGNITRQTSAGLNITKALVPLSITTQSLPPGTVQVAYPQTTLLAIGGTTPYAWSVTSGSLDGLSLNQSSGLLSGIPATAGTYSFTVRVTDAASRTANATFSLTVSPASTPLTIGTTSPLPNATVGVPYSPPSLSATGGTPPYSWTVTSGTLPPGLNLSSGALSGTPTTANVYTFSLGVADSASHSASHSFSLTVTSGTTVKEYIRMNGRVIAIETK